MWLSLPRFWFNMDTFWYSLPKKRGRLSNNLELKIQKNSIFSMKTTTSKYHWLLTQFLTNFKVRFLWPTKITTTPTTSTSKTKQQQKQPSPPKHQLSCVPKNIQMKWRNSIQASHSKARKRQKSCFWVGWITHLKSFNQNIGDFDLKWPPI